MTPTTIENPESLNRQLVDHCYQQHSEAFSPGFVHGHNASSRRKLEHQHQTVDVPYELVDDNEWDAIQSAFDALPNRTQQTELQNSLPVVSSGPAEAGAFSTTISQSMVPSMLQSPPLPPPLPVAAAHRFYHGPFCPGNSPHSLKKGEFHCQTGISSASQQVSTPERLKQSENSFGTGSSQNFSNGRVASPWKVGSRLRPCQFPTRNSSLGLGDTTRTQCAGECPELLSNDGTSVVERAACDFRPLRSQEHYIAPPESSEEPLRRCSEAATPNAEVGRELFKKLSVRRLPAWIEPAGRYLLSLERPRSVEQSQDVSGNEVAINSETVEEEQIRRPNPEKPGDVVSSALQQTEKGLPAWVQLDQPQIGLPWGLQPASFVDNVKPEVQKMQFRGQIVYSKTPSEVEAATDALLQRVHELQESADGAVPIGFDLEWKASFEKGVLPGKVAVLQLCIDARRCDVMQIIYSGIPSSLRDLLRSPFTLKVGVGIYGDASKLYQDYQISTRKITDLSNLANKKMKNRKQWSLSSLALELTGKQVDKTKNIRCGNWEALPLSEPQLQYAATDAFASLYLYQVLASFPNPESDRSESVDSKCQSESPTTQIREPESNTVY